MDIIYAFLNSNFFQTLILILTVVVTAGIYWGRQRNERRNAVTILMLQIDDIERNIEYILSEGIINGTIQEAPMHYSTIIYEENQWSKYSHLIVGHISQDAFEKVDAFFKSAYRIREQQIFIKQKIQQSIDSKAWHYYNAIYTQVSNSDDSIKMVETVHNRFNITNVPSFIHKEFAIGLEKTLKQYYKLTDGIAYTELTKLK